MARKFISRKPEDLENIVIECLHRIGISDVSDKQVALLTRLIFSGIANYFFNKPDYKIKMGYIEFMKNPEKEQLFAVNILKDEEEGVINADTLWRYYKGELATEAKLKVVIDEFMQDLLQYSQQQETEINSITKKLQ